MSEVDEAMKLLLHGAPNRHGGRNERAKKVVKSTECLVHRIVWISPGLIELDIKSKDHHVKLHHKIKEMIKVVHQSAMVHHLVVSLVNIACHHPHIDAVEMVIRRLKASCLHITSIEESPGHSPHEHSLQSSRIEHSGSGDSSSQDYLIVPVSFCH